MLEEGGSIPRAPRPQVWSLLARCIECVRAYHLAYGAKRRKGDTRRRSPIQLSPLPAMDLLEQLACVRFRNWRGPVNDGPLIWRIA